MPNEIMVNEINKAIFAHGAWKMRLRDAISKGSSDMTVDTAKRDDCCAFGKWLHGTEITSHVHGSAQHQTAIRLHKEFHLSAGKVLDEALKDHKDKAISLLKGEFGERSETLMIALTKWKHELSKSEAA